MVQRIREPDTEYASLLSASDGVVHFVGQSGALSAQSVPRFQDLVHRFVSYCATGPGFYSLADVTQQVSFEFVTAKSQGAAPAIATQHLRRSSLRLLFRYAGELGLADHDPTIDLVLPPRSNLSCRPLTDDEIAVCRSFSLWSLTNTRRPAAWALAEATARTAELPHIRIGDLDFDTRSVLIRGSSRTVDRRGTLSAWGLMQLERRVTDLRGRGEDDASFVIYEGDGSAQSRQASACLAISDTLAAAGFAGERDVRPLSIAAWRGAQVLATTGRVEDAALALGVRSLDRAARLIGFDWQSGEDSS